MADILYKLTAIAFILYLMIVKESNQIQVKSILQVKL